MLDQNEVNDTLLSKALVKRREWSEKYNVTDKDIFDLFSEFASMMMIAKNSGELEPEEVQKDEKKKKQKKGT